MDNSDTFFTIIGCMDGRILLPVTQYGQERFKASFADTITEAGLVEVIQSNPFDDFMENFKKKIMLSVNEHHSKGIIVYGHQDCAGNPVEDSLHKMDIIKSAGFIKSLVNDLEVVPVFVVKGKNWEPLAI